MLEVRSSNEYPSQKLLRALNMHAARVIQGLPRRLSPELLRDLAINGNRLQHLPDSFGSLKRLERFGRIW